MSDNYKYLYFSVRNFTNVESLTSYALSVCPFTFIPRTDYNVTTSNKRILWNFGDGSTSTSVSAVHAYTKPGTYNVTMYVYDGLGESYYNSFSKNVTVVDYIPDSIVLSTTHFVYDISNVESNSFDVYRFNSPSITLDTIHVNVSGASLSQIETDIYNSNKYSHLSRSSRFYQLLNGEYAVVDQLTTTNTNLYVQLSAGSIVPASENAAGSVFAGTSGYATASIAIDEPQSQPVLIQATFRNPAINDGITNTIQTYTESFYCTFSASDPTHLSITTTGISGMNIHTNQFIEAVFPIVVQSLNADGYVVKFTDNLIRVSDASPLTSNTIKLSVLNLDGSALSARFNDISISECGAYRGEVTCLEVTSAAYIAATANVSGSSGSVIMSLSSNMFKVLPRTRNIFKINENIVPADIFKSYRFQETLLNKAVFFDDFYGSIVGKLSGSPNDLGVKIYEKSANFIDNTCNIDTSNISYLYSIRNMLGIDIKQFEQYNFSVPADLSRIIDIASIKRSILWGSANTNQENYDTFNTVNSPVYGLNIGSRLNALTSVLTSGSASKPIVAYERFSDTYRTINTDLLSTIHVPIRFNNTYPLSAYHETWGWGLVLPSTFTPDQFDSFYEFYDTVLINSIDIKDAIIDWSNEFNTLTYSNSSLSGWSGDAGTIREILDRQLFTGLELI